jgi:hypothetical protein
MVKSLVDRNGWGFWNVMIRWIGVGIPATYVNAIIKVKSLGIFTE